MSVLCPTTCCPSHWTLTGFLPSVLFLCVSHIGVAERRSKKVCPLPLLSGEVCAWMGCMHAVSSFARSGRRSEEGQRREDPPRSATYCVEVQRQLNVKLGSSLPGSFFPIGLSVFFLRTTNELSLKAKRVIALGGELNLLLVTSMATLVSQYLLWEPLT